jgi:SAM-dependent methyltransferase
MFATINDKWEAPSDELRRFVREIAGVRFISAKPAISRHLLQCFRAPGVNYEELAQPAVSVTKLDPVVRSWLESFREGLSPTIDAAVLCALDVPLVHALLRKTIVRDLEFEALLIAARRAILSATQGSSNPLGPIPIEFAVSLASQCYNTEYVYPTEPWEEEQAEGTARELARRLGATSDTLESQEHTIAICGMYGPLWKLDRCERLLQIAIEPWAEKLSPLISAQVADHEEEAAIMGEIPVLAVSDDSVSKAVRQQYEESPYPRWLSTWVEGPTPLLEVLRSFFPLVGHGPDVNGYTQVLVPGCGTGSHPIEVAMRYQDVRVFALDLSRASLAYAVRMARRYGVRNIEFYQGDVLALDRVDRKFHFIDAFGVLHHVAAPSSALAILARCLEPSGFIKISVYNRVARRYTNPAREFLRARGVRTAADIRLSRHEALRLLNPDDDPLAFFNHDAFTVSEFRDHFLHAHAVDFTFPEIANAVWQAGLKLIGLYDLHPEADQAFERRFPDLSSLNDAARVAKFDRDYPNPTLHGLYQLLAQKV